MADKQIGDLTPATGMTDGSLFVIEQGAAAKNVTWSMLKRYISPGVAPQYSNSSTYYVGDYVIYNDQLYRCTTDITTPESWTAAHWVAASMGDEVACIKATANDLLKYNCGNLLDFCDKVDSSSNDVDYEWHGNSCTIHGTASALSFANIYANKAALPSWLKQGETYRASCATTNASLKIWFYKNNTYSSGVAVNSGTLTDVTVPSDAEGLVLRLQVENGTVINETVHPVILQSYSNEELYNLINTAFLYKGTLSNSYNPDNISGTGIYILAGNTYAPTPYGTLIHFAISANVRIQIIYQLNDLNIWYRKGNASTWNAWESTNQNYYRNYFYNDAEYLAFGDSLMYGALWNGTAQNPVITQAPYGSRIPDRIRKAVHCDNYTNWAVGGMAYTIASTGIPKFIDYIKSKDITGADLITIAGGRNDGPSQLGTYESESADGTICGAIKEIIEYIRGVNPSCQIVVIQVTPYTSTNNPFGSTSTAGWTLDSFDAQVSVLCKNMNVGYASWYGCSLFSKWSDFSGGGGNWAHMKDAEQYIQMGNFIAGQVVRYYHN